MNWNLLPASTRLELAGTLLVVYFGTILHWALPPLLIGIACVAIGSWQTWRAKPNSDGQQ